MWKQAMVALFGGMRWAWLMVLVSAPLLLAVADSVKASRKGCAKIQGSMSLLAAPSSACKSPVGICSQRVYEGNLRGDGQFFGVNRTNTPDTPQTSVAVVTGENAIVAVDGTLFTRKAMVYRSTGEGDFAELDTIIGGKGRWRGATGHIRATGRTNGSGGDGRYIGEICTAFRS